MDNIEKAPQEFVNYEGLGVIQERATKNFHRARFADTYNRYSPEQMKEKYLLAQSEYYKAVLLPDIEKAEFDEKELDRILEFVENGEVILTNEGFYYGGLNGTVAKHHFGRKSSHLATNISKLLCLSCLIGIVA